MPLKYSMFPSCIKCLSVTNFAVIERLGFTFYCLRHPKNKGGPRHSRYWIKFNKLNVSIFSFLHRLAKTHLSVLQRGKVYCVNPLSPRYPYLN